ncbi:hypothetical protein [Streptomyces triculaminicus]|uniref:hypothetical protein n=1 Tax=Streptomyces triculaminicus TaxID=2816232 RepID=UPI003790885B
MAETALYLCGHCGEPVTGDILDLQTDWLGTRMPAWHWDRPACRAAVLKSDHETTDRPKETP